MDINNLNICDCLSFAFSELKDCKLNIDNISEDSKAAIKRIADYYSINENEAILLILAIEAHYSSDNEFNIIGFKEIREKIGCDVSDHGDWSCFQPWGSPGT